MSEFAKDAIGFCTCYPGDSPERPAPDCGIPSHRVEGRRIRSATPPSAAVPDPADVEKVARAIAEADGHDLALWRSPIVRYSRMAVAALAAVRPSPDSEAVARVEALCDEWERLADEYDSDMAVTQPWQVATRAQQRRMRGVIRDLRAALGTGDREGRRR